MCFDRRDSRSTTRRRSRATATTNSATLPSNCTKTWRKFSSKSCPNKSQNWLDCWLSIFATSKSILEIRQSETVSTVYSQSPHRRHISSLLELSTAEPFLKRGIVDSEVEFALLGVELDLDDVSRSVAFLEVKSVFVGSIAQFARGVVGISILNIREGSFDVGYF